jgi:hypothetical protein
VENTDKIGAAKSGGAAVKRCVEAVAALHEVKRYYLTDREWEIAARDEQIKFAKYRKERGLDKR